MLRKLHMRRQQWLPSGSMITKAVWIRLVLGDPLPKARLKPSTVSVSTSTSTVGRDGRRASLAHPFIGRKRERQIYFLLRSAVKGKD